MNKKSLILFALLTAGAIAVFFLASVDKAERSKAAVGIAAPPFELKDTDGRTWRLSDFKGKVVLLNFWATWCDPCRDEIPSIQNLIDRERNNDRLVFISILFKDDPDKALKYLRDGGFKFPVLIDDKKIATRYGVTGVPETFVINAKGIIKDKIVGPMKWDSPDVGMAIRKLIGDEAS